MIAGIAFAVLFAAALLMVPTLPGIDKPGYDIVSHVNEHSGAMRMQALLVTFGSLALVVVLGYARDRLTGPPAYVFTIGSAVVLVEVFIAMWFTAGLALHPDQLGSATARTITDIAVMWGPILTVAEIMVAVPILLAANDDRVECLDDSDVKRVKCLRDHQKHVVVDERCHRGVRRTGHRCGGGTDRLERRARRRERIQERHRRLDRGDGHGDRALQDGWADQAAVLELIAGDLIARAASAAATRETVGAA